MKKETEKLINELWESTLSLNKNKPKYNEVKREIVKDFDSFIIHRKDITNTECRLYCLGIRLN